MFKFERRPRITDLSMGAMSTTKYVQPLWTPSPEGWNY
jgi:hypothetical protein